MKKAIPEIQTTENVRRTPAPDKGKQRSLALKTTKNIPSNTPRSVERSAGAKGRGRAARTEDLGEQDLSPSENEEPGQEEPSPKRKTKAGKGKTYVEYTKAEEEALEELEVLNRQHYAAGLNKSFNTQPTLIVFPNMPRSNPLFKVAMRKTARDYKNWKGVITKRIQTSVESWAKNHADDRARDSENFEEIRQMINEDFEWHWLDNVFPMFDPAIDFKECSELGLHFLQCKQ